MRRGGADVSSNIRKTLVDHAPLLTSRVSHLPRSSEEAILNCGANWPQGCRSSKTTSHEWIRVFFRKSRPRRSLILYHVVVVIRFLYVRSRMPRPRLFLLTTRISESRGIAIRRRARARVRDARLPPYDRLIFLQILARREINNTVENLRMMTSIVSRLIMLTFLRDNSVIKRALPRLTITSEIFGRSRVLTHNQADLRPFLLMSIYFFSSSSFVIIITYIIHI